MKFIKIDNNYIDLMKIVGVEFIDDDLRINLFSPGFGEYNLFISFDSLKKYLDNKRMLIKELISVSLNDCEVIEC